MEALELEAETVGASEPTGEGGGLGGPFEAARS